MLIEEKIEIAKQIQLLLEEPIEEFKITRITELNADYLLPITDKRGLGGVIIADDGTYMICGSAYSIEYYIEKFKDGKRDDIEKYKLHQLIEENSGPDPFWADSLKNYFKTVNKTSKEKLELFSNIITNNALFNEFTKETVKPANPDEIFEKYKTISDKNINNYKYYKQNDSDLIWWVYNHEQKGERLFTFDKKRIFSLFKDYPYNLSKEEKEIFDKENPYWRDFFIKENK